LAMSLCFPPIHIKAVNKFICIGTYFYPLLFRKINEYTIGCVYEYECSHYNETASFKQFF
ncbi:hypothetical protein ABH61_19680, partial [Bacillus paranthracis]|uniref:hypothetical protein n=1 Tax=Bacillus paranthracis TaxID=2026186 RepID=UPI001C9737DD